MKALVLGVGNMLLGDEAVGALAAQELERRFHIPAKVEILDGGTAGIELMQYIAGKDLLIIIDAVKCGKEPGTVVRAEGDDIPAAFRQRISPHQIGLSDLLATSMLLGQEPGKMVLFGVEPASMEIGIGLSDQVAASFERLLDLTVRELGLAGITLTKRGEAEMAAPSVWVKG